MNKRGQLSFVADVSTDLWGSGFGEVARRLLTAGVGCFATAGFMATTTRDITAGAGVSPAALYVHFPSKEAVLFEIVLAAHRDSLRVVREVEVCGDPADYLRTLVSHFVAWHARYHVAGRVSQYELSALSAEHFDVIVGLRHRTIEVFHQAIARGRGVGAFPVVDEHRVVRAIVSLGVDLVRWYRDDGADSPAELGEFYGELALGMVQAAGARARPPGDLLAGGAQAANE